MFRNISISVKITVLVTVITTFAIVAVGLLADSIFSQSNQNRLLVFQVTSVAVCVFTTVSTTVFAKFILRPMDLMHDTLSRISKGELPERPELSFSDEFGQMQSRVDELVEVLKQNAEFAQKVGEGKFDTNFRPAGENDSLGMALIEMRNNIVANDLREKEHNWIVQGLAEAGEILRRHDDLESLGDSIIKFAVQKVHAIQGAFYTVDSENRKIELRNTFAFNRKKYIARSFSYAEGLIGQAVAEQDTILRTEIPDDYVSITSGILGDKKPTCILIVPLIANEATFGVIELAGFIRFDDSQIKFIGELSVMLARTIFNINVNARTRELLAEAQELSASLKEKQYVLSQNAEEMRVTQEELTRSNALLEEQVEEVRHTRNRMQLLLENASEVITIYEPNGTIRYISPSVEEILGYTPAELQGRADLNHVQPEGRHVYTGLFKQLEEQPEQTVTVQFEYITKQKTTIWLEVTGKNLMSNAAIHGYIMNSRDITERRRAEQEQRMRSKMQALSENSTDLITRIENGVISYINPVIESYTGHTAATFLNQKAIDSDLDKSVLENWLRIVENVKLTQDKISAEMDFPSTMGARVMQINAMPEFNEFEQLESVLVVSHDITDRKQIEVDLQEKNKKINDSINYARRIQNAILPDSALIAKALPDSFILYKPRDVVSGDFPWFVQINDDIFIAAVDCTGHGVPGALLSLIGYFLLNDIVRSRRITEPGRILDLLDEGMTQTLKQDQGDAATKDGMDIALCRINTTTRVVEYAGAHRPLYVVRNGALEEIKGNKFPVGGGVSKNQTSFTTSTVTLASGDSIYFSSDGFPDQFGGPENRKFGSKKMRDLVEQVKHTPCNRSSQVFDQAWEAWRGGHKQTDDVLLIGVRL